VAITEIHIKNYHTDRQGAANFLIFRSFYSTH